MNWLSKNKKTNIFVGLMGDVMVGRLVNERLFSEAPEYIWGNFLPCLKETDLNLLNLEAALTRSTLLVPKVFNFKANPEKVTSLVKGSIGVVNLANNHILDFSTQGLLETVQTLDGAGIRHVGAGRNYEEAIRPSIFTCQGIKVGIMGCTDNEPTWRATHSSAGTLFLDQKTIPSLLKTIRKVKSEVDLLIVSVHWGPNMVERPSEGQISFAHQAIDHGADIIHGHSAHIFHGVGFYHRGLVLYDTGDFVDDYAVDPFLRNDRSFFFVVEAGKEGIAALYLIPVLISDCQVNLAQERDFSESVQRMQALSSEFNTTLILRDTPIPHLEAVYGPR